MSRRCACSQASSCKVWLQRRAGQRVFESEVKCASGGDGQASGGMRLHVLLRTGAGQRAPHLAPRPDPATDAAAPVQCWRAAGSTPCHAGPPAAAPGGSERCVHGGAGRGWRRHGPQQASCTRRAQAPSEIRRHLRPQPGAAPPGQHPAHRQRGGACPRPRRRSPPQRRGWAGTHSGC